MDLGLGGKSVLITGASKGIGRGIAEAFAAEGSRLTICARGVAGLDEARQSLRSAGAEVVAVPTDVTKLDDLQRAVDQAIAAYGRIDVLINNAGEGWLGRSYDTTEEQWEHAIQLNLLSAIRLTRMVVPQMRTLGQGRIINIASVSGHPTIFW